jgi:hypothetical protein
MNVVADIDIHYLAKIIKNNNNNNNNNDNINNNDAEVRVSPFNNLYNLITKLIVLNYVFRNSGGIFEKIKKTKLLSIRAGGVPRIQSEMTHDSAAH